MARILLLALVALGLVLAGPTVVPATAAHGTLAQCTIGNPCIDAPMFAPYLRDVLCLLAPLFGETCVH